MNPRERTLLMALIGVLIGGAGLFFFHQWFWKPWRDLETKIEEAEADLEKSKLEKAVFLRDIKKLDLARRKSLPANPNLATSAYMNYLQTAFQKSGFKGADISHGDPVPMPLSVKIPGVQKVGHNILAFRVVTKGELRDLIKVIDLLQHTPYEHRIKTLNIDRESMSTAQDASSRLNINMTLETLLVADSRGRNGIPPGFDVTCVLVDAMTARATGGLQVALGEVASGMLVSQAQVKQPLDRAYDQIKEKNIFVGARPARYVTPKREKEGPDPPDEYLPQFIRLSTTVPTENTAYLRNMLYETRERKVVSTPGSGYDIFVVKADNDYTYFEAKVLCIEARKVYFQIKHTKDIYAVEVGQSLADAIYGRGPIEKALEGTGKSWLNQEAVSDMKKYPLRIEDRFAFFDDRGLDLKLFEEWSQPKKETTARRPFFPFSTEGTVGKGPTEKSKGAPERGKGGTEKGKGFFQKKGTGGKKN